MALRWLIAVAGLVLLAPGSSLGQGGLTDRLYVYASFERGVAADYAIGAEEPGVPGPHRLGPGRWGQGLVVDTARQARPAGFLVQTNLDNEAGTVAFFIRPDWSWTDQSVPLRQLALMPGIGGMGWMICRNQYNCFTFSTGYTDETGWHWRWDPDPPVPPSWREGEWHHIGVTWDYRHNEFTRVLYLDGAEAERVSQRNVRPSVKSDRGVLTFGSESAPGTYDEVGVWGRALSAGEMREVASGRRIEALQRAARALQARKPVDLFEAAEATFDEPDGAYFERAVVQARVSWRLRERAAPARGWRWWVEDLWGRRGRVTQVRFPTPTTRVDGALLHIPPDGRMGAFRIVAALDAPGRPRRDVGSFARLPRRLAAQPCRPDSPFGGHLWWEQQPFHCRLGRKIGVRWVRFHDLCNGTWWPHAEPRPGHWVWMDPVVNLYRDHGFQMLGTLSFTPAWAAGQPEAESPFAFLQVPPTDLQAFARYVRQVVGHYKDRVHAWEVWNEPQHGGFWSGTPEEYGELLEVACRAAREADPRCTIVGGGGLNLADRAWIERMLGTGCLSAMDVLSIHYYTEDEPPPPGRAPLVEELRRMMARHGKPVPIWNTEHAVYSASLLRELQRGIDRELERQRPAAACATLIKAVVTNLARGVRKFFYYAMWRNESWAARATNPFNTNLIDAGNTLHPLGVAYATAVDRLEGARFYGWARTDRQVAACVFARRAGAVAVAWTRAPDGEPAPRPTLRLPASAGLRVFDMMNNALPLQREGGAVAVRLGPEPLFIETARAGPDALLSVTERGRVPPAGTAGRHE